jgi:hypothetical protein
LQYTLLLCGSGVVRLAHCFDQNQEQHSSATHLRRALMDVYHQSFCEMTVEKPKLVSRNRLFDLPFFLGFYS